MASGTTNKGKFRKLEAYYRQTAQPASFFLVLVTSAVAPVADTNTLSELTQIAGTNGYTQNGFQLTPGATDFDVLTEDDANDRAFVQLKDIAWVASGGPIPASGAGARWAVMTDDNVTPGSREVIDWYDLVSDRSVSDGQTLTLQDAEQRIA